MGPVGFEPFYKVGSVNGKILKLLIVILWNTIYSNVPFL
jgi:hypothetical protein